MVQAGCSAAMTSLNHAGFVSGLKRDLAPVRAGLPPSLSSGPAEGQIRPLETIELTMCGWAGFDLLRHRVLDAA